MVYRTRRTYTRRSFKKKRFSKMKKRFTRRKTGKKYDRPINVTINCTKTISQGGWTQGTIDYQTRWEVKWGSTQGGAGHVMALTSSPEWGFWAARFAQYRVNGCKIDYKTNRSSGGGSNDY